MATFEYVGRLDTTQAQFSIEQFGGNSYLQFGRLQADNRRLLESIIAGGYVGFFQDGQEIAHALIMDRYSSNGIQIEALPSALSHGQFYEIRWTQARPGEPGEATTVSVDQGIVRFSTGVRTDVNEPTQFNFDYRVVDERYVAFQPRFYASPSDFDTDRPIPEDDPRYPQDIEIIPPLPFVSPGFYVHDIRLTPTYAGDLLVDIELLTEAEAPLDPVRPTVGLLEVDRNGAAETDIHGNFVIENSNTVYTYETDIHGNFEVDRFGNRVLEIVHG